MKTKGLQFEPITDDGRLWTVCYEEDFFEKNLTDLSSYFHIVDIDEAIFDTIQDARTLECLILDLKPGTNLDEIFRPLDNLRAREMMLSKEKAKGKTKNNHPSWLRLYAIRFEQGKYLITGGAIKLTRTMEERQHTLNELVKMEQIRNYLIENGAFDFEGFLDLTQDGANN